MRDFRGTRPAARSLCASLAACAVFCRLRSHGPTLPSLPFLKLAALGVDGVMADPKLELLNDDTGASGSVIVEIYEVP